jgi:hypothetical protein
VPEKRHVIVPDTYGLLYSVCQRFLTIILPEYLLSLPMHKSFKPQPFSHSTTAFIPSFILAPSSLFVEMFSKSLIASIFLLVLTSSVNAHLALWHPAVDIEVTPTVTAVAASVTSQATTTTAGLEKRFRKSLFLGLVVREGLC